MSSTWQDVESEEEIDFINKRYSAVAWAADRNTPVDGDTAFDVNGFLEDLEERGWTVVKKS